MNQQVHLFTSFFPENTDYLEKQNENLLEFVSDHTLQEQPGYLFKHLPTTSTLFVRKDQLLSGPVEEKTIYCFMGYVDNSSVVILQKNN